MDKPKIIVYQNRQLDLTQLKRVAGQGNLISVTDAQLNVVHRDANHPELVVVATGPGSYDVLLGYARTGTQNARLVSKIVLKKALVEVRPPEPPPAQRSSDTGLGNRPFEQLGERYNRNPSYGRDFRRY